MLVLAGGGLRATEAAILEVGQVDHRHNRLIVEGTKTSNAVRRPDMPPRLMKRLEPYVDAQRHRGRGAPLFVNRTGRPRNRHTVRDQVKRVAIRAELLAEAGIIPAITDIALLTAHDLRRTYIALLLARNMDLAKVQAQVGHSTSNTKMILEIYNSLRSRVDRSQNWSNVERDLLGPPGAV